MTRHYDEPAQVECGWVETAGAEGPAHLLWRGRLYRVRDVLAHWVETGAWWQSTAIRSLHDGAVPESEHPGSSALLLDTGWDPAEREVWRVEAQAGRSAPIIVLDVALDTATGQWRVVRSHD